MLSLFAIGSIFVFVFCKVSLISLIMICQANTSQAHKHKPQKTAQISITTTGHLFNKFKLTALPQHTITTTFDMPSVRCLNLGLCITARETPQAGSTIWRHLSAKDRQGLTASLSLTTTESVRISGVSLTSGRACAFLSQSHHNLRLQRLADSQCSRATKICCEFVRTNTLVFRSPKDDTTVDVFCRGLDFHCAFAKAKIAIPSVSTARFRTLWQQSLCRSRPSCTPRSRPPPPTLRTVASGAKPSS